jgi:hypothetical protein
MWSNCMRPRHLLYICKTKHNCVLRVEVTVTVMLVVTLDTIFTLMSTLRREYSMDTGPGRSLLYCAVLYCTVQIREREN